MRKCTPERSPLPHATGTTPALAKASKVLPGEIVLVLQPNGTGCLRNIAHDLIAEAAPRRALMEHQIVAEAIIPDEHGCRQGHAAEISKAPRPCLAAGGAKQSPRRIRRLRFLSTVPVKRLLEKLRITMAALAKFFSYQFLGSSLARRRSACPENSQCSLSRSAFNQTLSILPVVGLAMTARRRAAVDDQARCPVGA
jgi:hypothetical protein